MKIIVEFRRESDKWQIKRYIEEDGARKEVNKEELEKIAGPVLIGGFHRFKRVVEVEEERVDTKTYMKRVYELRNSIPDVAFSGGDM